MQEKEVFFKSGGLNIEGRLCDLPGSKGVIVTHPHPLYGGDMDSEVVDALVSVYIEKGYSTLRFNFRGVGRSEGVHDHGQGEQEDLRSAIGYIHDLGKKSLDLAGYSFGAWVNALGLETYDHVRRLIMISPPISFVDFSFLKQNSKIQLVVVGSKDDFAHLDAVEKTVPQWNPDAVLRIIRGANHFYMLKIPELKAAVADFLERTED